MRGQPEDRGQVCALGSTQALQSSWEKQKDGVSLKLLSLQGQGQ